MNSILYHFYQQKKGRYFYMNEPNYMSIADIQARPLPPGFETVSGPLQYTLLNDLLFRMVFEANQNGLKSLLAALLHLKESDITKLEIKNPFRFGTRVDEKKYIYDLYLLLNNKQKIHIELQVLNQSFWTDRSLCYLCRDFGDLNSGENYNKVKPHIQIDILDFSLFEDSNEFFSTYHLANDKTGRIYSDKLSLHVLQLNKTKYATEEDKACGIYYWAKLFKATTWEELKFLTEKQASLQSTVETMYRFTADDYTREEIRAREEELRLQRTIELEMKEKKDKIAEQTVTIAEQTVTITEQKATITEQNATITEQNEEIKRLRKQIEELQKQAGANL